MVVDRYTRIVLTVIAAALVYLCVVMTPLPTVHAQRGGLRPGDDTGPAQVVVVGWRTTDQPSMQVAGSVPLPVTGEVGINGVVQVQQTSNVTDRVVVVGWERNAVLGPKPTPGQPTPINQTAGLGLPVTDNGAR